MEFLGKEHERSMLPPYISKGSGPAIVFSNSAVSDYRLFQPQIDALSDEFHTVGYNSRALTDEGLEPYTLWDLADDCRELLDHLGIDQCVIAGSSMGGYMALRFAVRYPERLKGMILVGSTAVPNLPGEVVAFLDKFEEMAGQPTIPREWAEWCSSVVFSERARQQQPDLVNEWIERWVQYPADAIIEEARCWLNREDMTPHAAEITIPTLILHGEEDAAIPLERTAPLADQLPDARLLPIAGAGHFVSLEAADAVTSEMRDFLRTVYG
jgi:pimeloyl-ACP methyl ester carboxylesterase